MNDKTIGDLASNLMAEGRLGRQSIASVTDLQPAIRKARLMPCSADTLLAELGSVLALVGASGMTAEDREEWLAAACITLREIPEDMIRRGADAARRKADHPSKVVKIIMEEIELPMRWRRNQLNDSRERIMQIEDHSEPDYCSPEEAAAIRKEFGI